MLEISSISDSSVRVWSSSESESLEDSDEVSSSGGSGNEFWRIGVSSSAARGDDWAVILGSSRGHDSCSPS